MVGNGPCATSEVWEWSVPPHEVRVRRHRGGCCALLWAPEAGAAPSDAFNTGAEDHAPCHRCGRKPVTTRRL